MVLRAACGSVTEPLTRPPSGLVKVKNRKMGTKKVAAMVTTFLGGSQFCTDPMSPCGASEVLIKA